MTTSTAFLLTLPTLIACHVACEVTTTDDTPNPDPSSEDLTIREQLTARIANDYEAITVQDDRTFSAQAYDEALDGRVYLCADVNADTRVLRLEDVQGELSNLCPAGELTSAQDVSGSIAVRSGDTAQNLGALNGEAIGTMFQSGNVGIETGDVGEWLFQLRDGTGAYVVVEIDPTATDVAFDVCEPRDINGQWDIDCDGSSDL